MSTASEKYNLWKKQSILPEELKLQLSELEGDKDAIYDAFYSDLSFGTSGLRGIMGPGTNRMNLFVVRKASQGVSEYILKNYDNPSVVIGYDSRNNSKLFAYNAAAVFTANGIKTYVFKDITPVAEVSYAIAGLGTSVGIMITASHNPRQYNGYKVYNHRGCQITGEQAEQIQQEIDRVDIFTQPMGSITECMPSEAESVPDYINDNFIEDILSQRFNTPDLSDLNIIYTPLNGAGYVPVTKVLKRLGIEKLHIVEEQKLPDGNFPTCPKPNPEMEKAFDRAFELDRKIGSDIIIATDPDCDRVGVAVNHNGKHVLLSGNELGVLLFHYICRMRQHQGTLPKNPIAVRSIVSTPTVDRIAWEYGIEMKKTLIGFKYIGEIICELQDRGEADRFVFGFEESKGYLSDGFVRDKEGVSAVMLTCQMAAHYKKEGKTLLDVLDDIYRKYRYHIEENISEEMEGFRGRARMEDIMESFRNEKEGQCMGLAVKQKEDYMQKACRENILSFTFENDVKMIVRPSGSEPKIKYYIFSEGKTREEAEKNIQKILTKLEQR